MPYRWCYVSGHGPGGRAVVILLSDKHSTLTVLHDDHDPFAADALLLSFLLQTLPVLGLTR